LILIFSLIHNKVALLLFFIEQKLELVVQNLLRQLNFLDTRFFHIHLYNIQLIALFYQELYSYLRLRSLNNHVEL